MAGKPKPELRACEFALDNLAEGKRMFTEEDMIEFAVLVIDNNGYEVQEFAIALDFEEFKQQKGL